MCERRLPRDWLEAFGHRRVLLETFVDLQRHRATLYQSSNWLYFVATRGYRRRRVRYTDTPKNPKNAFLRGLRGKARTLLCHPNRRPRMCGKDPD